jgi:hypothetical protein
MEERPVRLGLRETLDRLRNAFQAMVVVVPGMSVGVKVRMAIRQAWDNINVMMST